MGVAAHAAQLYIEGFEHPSGWALGDVGWSGVFGGGSWGGLHDQNYPPAPIAGPANAAYMYHDENISTGYECVMYTNEYTVNTTTYPNIGFKWDMRIAYVYIPGTTPVVSIVVKVGGTWYVSKATYISTMEYPNWDIFTYYYNPAKENWDTFTIGTAARGAPAGSDLSGNITEFGLYSDSGPVGGEPMTAEYDDFIVQTVYAYAPVPDNFAKYIDLDADLGWSLVAGVNNVDVYFGTDSNGGTFNPKVVDANNVTSYEPGTLAYETDYFWRVDVRLLGDPNLYISDEWTFTTAPSEPVILSDPEFLTVAAGDTAEFLVGTLNATTHDWFKDGNSISGGGDITIDSDANGSTLTISNVDVNDEGYYDCNVSNAVGSVWSDEARLLTERLMGHWKFEDNMVDEVADNDGNFVDPDGNPGTPSYGSGIVDGNRAIVFGTDSNYVEIPDSNYFNFYPQGYTVSCWLKTSADPNNSYLGIISKSDVNDQGQGWMLMSYLGEGYDYQVQIGSITGQTNLNDNQWHFVVGTYEPNTGTAALYVDGLFEGQVTGNAVQVSSVDALLKIGIFPGYEGNNWPYEGLVDDVKVYSYALGPYYIAALYTDVVGGSVCVEPHPLDADGDCEIGLADAKKFAEEWLGCNKIPPSSCY